MGTFILNTNGQLIGWVTDKYDREGKCNMTTIASISDYKGVLQNLSNGFAAPYFGIRGQEVNSAMRRAASPGDLCDRLYCGQPCVQRGNPAGRHHHLDQRLQDQHHEGFPESGGIPEAGDKVNVAVQRNGKDSYKEIEYPVTIGAR